jgi:hypothetical protein
MDWHSTGHASPEILRVRLQVIPAISPTHRRSLRDIVTAASVETVDNPIELFNTYYTFVPCPKCRREFLIKTARFKDHFEFVCPFLSCGNRITVDAEKLLQAMRVLEHGRESDGKA